MKYKHFYVSGKPLNIHTMDSSHCSRSKRINNDKSHYLPSTSFSSKKGVPLLWTNFKSRDKLSTSVQRHNQSQSLSYSVSAPKDENSKIGSKRSSVHNESLTQYKSSNTSIDSGKPQLINLMDIFWPDDHSLLAQISCKSSQVNSKLPFKKWREQERVIADENFNQSLYPFYNDSKTLLGVQSVKKMMIDGSKAQKYQISKLHHKLENFSRKHFDQDELIKKGTAITSKIEQISVSSGYGKPYPKYAWGSSKPVYDTHHNYLAPFDRTDRNAHFRSSEIAPKFAGVSYSKINKKSMVPLNPSEEDLSWH